MDSRKSKAEQDRNKLFGAIRENETSYEGKITVIGAGSVGLSMAFIATVNQVICWCLFYAGITMLIASLLINLSLYLIGNRWFRAEIDKIDDAIKNGQDHNSVPEIQRINRSTSRFNWMNLIILFIGILFMTVFICINVKR